MTKTEDNTHHSEPHNSLCREEIEEEVEQLERQLSFVLKLWHDRDENYERIAHAFQVGAGKVRTKAQGIKNSEDRQDMLRKIERILSEISFHNQHPPYVPGSGGQRPAPPRGRISSINPGGLPGFGKRR